MSPTRGSFVDRAAQVVENANARGILEDDRAIERTEFSGVTAERRDPHERRAALGGRWSLKEHESKRGQCRRRNVSTQGPPWWRDCIA